MSLIASAEEWINGVLESKGLTVVDAFSPWCGPCTAVLPTFQRLQNHLQQSGLKMNFILADTDTVDDLKKYNVGAEPLFIIFMDGKVKETVGGGVNLPRILRTLSKYISPDAIFSFSPAQEAPPPLPFTPRGADAHPLVVTPRSFAAQQQQPATQEPPSIQIMVPSLSNRSIDLMAPDLLSDTASTTDTIDDTASVDEKHQEGRRKMLKSPRASKKPSSPKLSLSPTQSEHNQASPRNTRSHVTKQNTATKLKKSGSAAST